MIETKIHMGREPYSLYIGKNLIHDLEPLLDPYIENRPIFILTEENVYGHYGKRIIGRLKDKNSKLSHCVIPAGEGSKSMESYKKIITELTEGKFGRDTILIALGGGMIGDLGGFIASTYMRGIDLIHIPTTLLAHIDSSVGGKTAINFQGFKNIIGTFYHPKVLIMDTKTLETLPYREYTAAFGEIIKYGMLADYELLVDLNEKYDKYLGRQIDLEQIILKCIKIKEKIVMQDEKDFGLRQTLNLGHTFAHGIESSTGLKQFFHGEAVALGIYFATTLSFDLGLITEDYHSFIKKIIRIYFPHILRYKLNTEKILEYMVMDKKNKGDSPIFILPTDKEKVEIFSNIPIEVVKKIILEATYELTCK